MQHGGWMAEPRRADHLNDDHLNEDAPAGPHVRTSQLVATSGRCGRTSSEKKSERAGEANTGTRLCKPTRSRLASFMAVPLVARSSRCRATI